MNEETLIKEFLENKNNNFEEDKTSVKFVLQNVFIENDYNKWFDIYGIDLDTQKKISIPIRNNVVDTFVEKNWPKSFENGEIDHWDFYKELAANKVPMLWIKDELDYFMPYHSYSKKKWKRLSWHMSNMDFKLSVEKKRKRDITIHY